VGVVPGAPTRIDVEQEASKLFNKVMSPFCPGRTIANCPSPQAAELQVTIKDRLAEGESPAQIEEELYAAFGDEIRAIPRARGFNLLAWGIPILFFGLGLVVLVRWMRGLAPTAAAASTSSGDAEMDERLKKELENIER
jgi:cytochrome c-type biogenesis protein CcmH